MSSWQPNPNAKPFTPASAYFSIPVPCKKTPIRVRKKGIFSRIIQWILVIVLCVTVIINLIFIWDTTKRYQRDAHGPNANKVQEDRSGLKRKQNPGKLLKVLWNNNRLQVHFLTCHLMNWIDQRGESPNIDYICTTVERTL